MTEHSDTDITTPQPRVSSARRSSDSTSSLGRTMLWVLVGIAAVLLVAVGIDLVSSFGRIHPGVTVAGVAVGGKSPAEATAILKTALPALAATPVVVNGGKQTWTVKSSDLGVSFDYAALVGDAMKVGRSDGFVASVGQRMHAWLRGEQLPAPAVAEPAKLAAALGKIADAVDVAPKNATLSVTADGVTAKPSATGIAVEREVLAKAVLSAFTAGNRAVTVTATTAQPHVTDAAAARAKVVVAKMISAPVTVTFDSKSWTLSSAAIAKMISTRAVEASGSGGWSIDAQVTPAEVSKAIVPMVGTALGDAPTDARVLVQNNSVVIVPSKNGAGPDVKQFTADLNSTLRDDAGSRTVALRSAVRPAKFTTAQAQSMGIHDRISTFTTAYSGGAAGRANNIRVLGAALDGKLVAPGETFSVNGAIGQRTASKGYTEANAIVKGKLVPQIGGGICQVCTTLFNTVFMSGLPITERQPHSFYISHYPTGRDATVSWDGPDLKWKNTTSHWVMVSVSLATVSPKAGSITISLYGTNPGYNVTYTTSPFTNIKPFTTIKVPDPTLSVGKTVLLDPGVVGQRVVVTRLVKKGATVVRTDTFTSDYAPKEATLYVGTKAPATKAPAPAHKP